MKNPVELVTTVIIDEVQAACEKIGITNGAIGICIEPKTSETAEWVNIPPYAMTVSYVSPIDRLTEETLCRNENGDVVGDAFGVVGMKIASLRQLMRYYEKNNIVPKDKEQLTSGAIPEELLGNGLTKWKGGVAIPVGVLANSLVCPHMGTLAMYIYVAVSGGKQDQDEAAAWAALDVVREYIVNEEEEYMLERCLCEEE